MNPSWFYLFWKISVFCFQEIHFLCLSLHLILLVKIGISLLQYSRKHSIIGCSSNFSHNFDKIFMNHCLQNLIRILAHRWENVRFDFISLFLIILFFLTCRTFEFILNFIIKLFCYIIQILEYIYIINKNKKYVLKI